MVAALQVPRATAPEPSPPVVEPREAAAVARLRYVSDASPGITRHRAGKHWRYKNPDGTALRDDRDIDRIRAIAIPPAWTGVWICPDPQGHIQATGRDARGRKQYRYHARWHEVRGETKFGRIAEFARCLPAIRARVDADLARPGLPRERVLATVVRLLESTLIRIGNNEYARANDSFGLTTLRGEHADVSGSSIEFSFRGKSGKQHTVGLRDRRLAAVVKRCQDLPGEDLFQYVNGDGEPRSVNSTDVNAYLGDIGGDDFTAKDFRTWGGTVLATMALLRAGSAEDEPSLKRNIVAAVDEVASALGNTRAVCRASYIHPAILAAYEDGSLASAAKRCRARPQLKGLAPEECVTLCLIERAAAAEAA
jgi:DNA topoisomerase-1